MFWREERGALLLSVRLTPRAALDRIDGVATGADGRTVLQARVRAVPEKGRANAALAILIADWLDRPKSAVSVVAGGTSRLKTVRLEASENERPALVARLLSAE
ncbi:DUF167 family protein [Mangrovicella endophytica]|uniref:DUF167 family protein n=1 Tax=Mangrovicella endophytica TaxID=2066697 RepID=UPI000C9DF83C|nr:DUF167 family protein [Mangrovicella endophytica]